MTGRVFLTLLVGILVTAGISWWLATNERHRAVDIYREFQMLDRAEQIVVATDAVPAAARDNYLKVATRYGVRLEALGQPLPAAAGASEFAQSLGERLGAGYQVRSLAPKPDACRFPPKPPLFWVAGPWRGTCESIDVRLRDGQWVRLQVLPPRPMPGTPKTDLSIITALFLVSIALLAYAVARMTTRPLGQLVQAAKDLGNDINHTPLELAGASEIRQASAAFNAMQARIRQYIAQRTQMLAAITHDLQTPLTRLRLRLEKVADPELRQRLVEDLSAMQEMVREGLDLARSTDTNEAMQALDLDSLLDSVCADALDAGQQVALAGRVSMTVLGRPLALRRALVNLVDNAVKYGLRAQVTVEKVNGTARVRVRDNGPGIAPGELARVFEPFYRIEGSRSRASGGTGLGLTIARNIAEQHGGTLTLANHPQGGLEATLVLPQYYKG